MFLAEGLGHRWTFNPETRGRLKGREVVVKLGFFVLEHVATGKLLLGHAKECSAVVDKNLADAMNGTHPCTALVRLLGSDCEVRVYEYPTVSLKDAQRQINQVKATIVPPYLLLN